MYIFFVFFQCFIEDKDIVKVNYNDFIDEIFQNIVDYNYWIIGGVGTAYRAHVPLTLVFSG